MKRVIFYFDGFNTYNGLKSQSKIDSQWKNYYWIDLVKFCSQFVYEGSELVAVKYFTSPPMNAIKRSKQSAFLGANILINRNKFIVYNGQYIHKAVDCEALCKKPFKILEEKRTDASIAINILLDCMEDKVDTIVLITADSDQIPTIKTIKQRFPGKKLKIYFPPCRTSFEITNEAKLVVYLENQEDKLKASIMEFMITNGTKKYSRPPEWKD